MEFRVLEGVPPDDVRAFLATARRRPFEREAIVFHHGDAAETLHLITKGRFAVRIVTPFGRSAMLAIRGPGETFGEFALLATDARRAVTVAALEPGETLSIGRDAFMDLARRYPQLKDVLVALLAERLRYADERIVAAHFLDADARVRWALLQLVRTYGCGDEVVVPLTQENLAELAGTARGTVNRVLNEEQGRGVVAVERGRRPCSLGREASRPRAWASTPLTGKRHDATAGGAAAPAPPSARPAVASRSNPVSVGRRCERSSSLRQSVSSRLLCVSDPTFDRRDRHR